MAQRPAYNYGSTARKLAREQEANTRAIHVAPGGAREERPASSAAILFARVLVILIVAFALIGCVRISLASATVTAAMEANQIDDLIGDARDYGAQLEVTQSSLANPTRVKRDALANGMRSPSTSTFIDISGDVVVRDGSGKLSLSGTVNAVGAVAAAEQAEHDAARAEADAAAAAGELDLASSGANDKKALR